MKTIKAILWDNDGVLVDTERLYYRATTEAFRRAGIKLTRAEYIKHYLVEATGTDALAEAKGLPLERANELRQERNRIHSEHLRTENIVIPGVRKTLERLHGKCMMAIVTSAQKNHFKITHERSGLLPFFDFVIDCDSFTEYKPHPEPYIVAIRKTGFTPGECIAVEDSERGLRSACAAGLKCIVIPTSLSHHGSFTGAYRILEKISQVPEAINTYTHSHQ